MTTVKKVSNPFGQDWLDNLKSHLPTVERLNISDNRILIDGNRKFLLITGHQTTSSKGNLGTTKIYCEGTDLKIKTTAMLPYIFIGLIFPIFAIVTVLVTSSSTIFSLIGTMLFIWTPVYFVRDVLKQDKFSEEVKKEIELLIKA